MGTRLGQAGFEFRSLFEFSASYGDWGTLAVINTASAKTGSFVAGYSSQTTSPEYAYWTTTASQIQLAYHFNQTGLSSGSGYLIIGTSEDLQNSFTVLQGTDNVLRLFSNGSLLGSGSTPIATNIWYHLGLDARIATSGWLAVYLDGELEIFWSGNNLGAGSRLKDVRPLHQEWSNAFKRIWWDDVWLEDTSGSATHSAPPDRRFVPLLVQGAGASSNWDPTGTASNFQAVDDWTSSKEDGTTTYVSTSVNNQVDFYNMEDQGASTLAASDTFAALIVAAVGLKTNATASTQINLALRSNGSTNYGADLDLGSGWSFLSSRYTTDPNTGAAWSGSAAINAAQFGLRSRGL